MKKIQIVLGNQLFPMKFYRGDHLFFMCEDNSLCTHFKYHKHKIIFFLASMRNFRDELNKKEKKVYYYDLEKEYGFFDALSETIKNLKVDEIDIYEIEDKFFEKQVADFCHKKGLKLTIRKTPMFLVSRETFKKYNEKTKKPFMKTFYESFRKNSGILMDKDGLPVGGKFSFDSENRKKIPKKFNVIHNEIKFEHDQNTKDVIKVVDKYFKDHPGEGASFWMHVSRKGALIELDNFIKNKLDNFGVYEDAIDTRDPFLYHSVLSPYLNIGFITPEEVVKAVLKSKEAPLNSIEGFVRQVIGWREFIRGIYQEYSEKQETSNFFNHKNQLGNSWYTGETGILPLDDVIKKTMRLGYCHHIERLMIISNCMLLCEIDPQEVYRWFMEMFVDSSDWVMGPNVFGMAQFSDGGVFATKPYISGSNYIHKMSHYKKDDWSEILDGLYWRFIHRKRDFLQTNYRMSMMVKMLDKMEPEKKERIFSKAETFIKENTV